MANPSNNPFKQLFGNDDTEVYSENNHIYFKTEVSRDTINRLCTLIRRNVAVENSYHRGQPNNTTRLK